MIKRMMMALCIFVCTFTLVACSGQQTNEPLTLGVNAIITEIDKENKIITTKDSEEKGVLGNDCLIDCSKIPMIYCNYDTQNVVAITLDDLQVGDEIILTIRSSEIENLQKEDDNKTKIAVEQCLAFEATLTDRQIDMLQELGYLPVITRQYGKECANCPYTLDEREHGICRRCAVFKK
mgnify:CR=1 FL=1